MYSLDVNFLKDRRPTTSVQRRSSSPMPAGSLLPLFIGIGVAVVLPGLAGGALWFIQGQTAQLDDKIAQLDQENKRLDAQIGDLKKIQAETAQIQGETKSLVSVFDQIRPWSATLQDLRDRIPQGAQIETMKQIAAAAPEKGQPPGNPAGGVEMTGLAHSFNEVNDFLLSLQQSRFFKPTETKIITAELVNAPLPVGLTLPPGVIYKPPQIVKYTIQSTLSDIPASELIGELEAKGTKGLVTRIRTMQDQGVITK